MNIEKLGELYKTAEAVMRSQTHSNANFVPGVGVFNGYMIVAEAPGEEEDKERRPLVGSSGKLLYECMADIDFPSEIFMTNVWKLRPPMNRTPNSTEISIGRKFLSLEIQIVQPHTVIALGQVANIALWPPKGKERGKLYNDDIPRTISTYHPGYLLDYRHPELVPTFKHHLRMAIINDPNQSQAHIDS